MAITAADVKKLREQTGVGMMDCKKALTEAEGDFDKAVEILRTKGQATAEKRAGRTAAEGKVRTLVKDGLGVNVELNCETDFVARNDDFQKLADELAELILKEKPADLEALSALELPSRGKTVAAAIEETTGSIGEKIVLSRFEVFDADGGFVEGYNHMGGKIGVLVQMKGNVGDAEEARAVARDVAMQVAAMNPSWVRPEEIPAGELEKEKQIQRQRAAEEGKPEKMLDKIAEGRMNKFYKEVCVLEQPFVKEQKMAVKEVLQDVASKLGAELDLVRFSRFQVGETAEA